MKYLSLSPVLEERAAAGSLSFRGIHFHDFVCFAQQPILQMTRLTENGRDLPKITNTTKSLLLSAHSAPGPVLGTALSSLILRTITGVICPITDEETRGRACRRSRSCSDRAEVHPEAVGPQIALFRAARLGAELDLEKLQVSQLLA